MSTADSSPIPADAAPADRPLVRVSHVSKFYGDFQALDDVSLDIHRGEVVAVIGASGSGKSTLCRTINRLETIQEGTIEIDGELLPEEGRELTRLRAEVGMVFQSFNLFPHRTVLDNITLAPMRVRRQPRAQAQERARELLERVGLADQAFKRPPQLSGGQAQRVGVARALAADPGLLLMDEPFGAVDPLVRRELQRELIRIQAELAKTILVVTHDVDEALALGDEIILLRDGARIAQRGSGAQLLADPADDFVVRFLGLDDADRALRLAEVAGRRVVLDGAGRALGRLAAEPGESGEPGESPGRRGAGRAAEPGGRS